MEFLKMEYSREQREPFVLGEHYAPEAFAQVGHKGKSGF